MWLGTPVEVIDQPIKFGWHDGALWLEANPSLAQSEAIEAGRAIQPEAMPDQMAALLMFEALGRGQFVDWGQVDDLVARRTGIATPVTRDHRD